ncbi:MAG TPA: 4-hydroxybenzoyl-CoA reductase subunit beta [Albitalea sp.]|nr:4-hydroxybenzoyl-CoA reductase subunit beta [Albitalea sp.]
MESVLSFELRRPATLQEAVAALAEPGARALAGGTDLLPNLRRGIEAPARLVSLAGVSGFDRVQHSASAMSLGAGITLARLAGDAALRAQWTALAEAAESVAAPTHRHAATLGGNLCVDTRCVFYNQSAWWRAANGHCLKRGGTVCHVAPQGQRCHAAFCGDVAPALLVLGAEAELVSPAGTRRVPLAQLYRDDGAAHLALAPGELLASVHLPRPARGTASGYRKSRLRGAIDFPLAGVAMALTLQHGSLASLQVALTGTNSRPLLLEGTASLLGRPVDGALQQALGKLVAKQASPARTSALPSQHRRLAAVALAEQLLGDLVQQATAP